jgi:hypothetical protein
LRKTCVLLLFLLESLDDSARRLTRFLIRIQQAPEKFPPAKISRILFDRILISPRTSPRCRPLFGLRGRWGAWLHGQSRRPFVCNLNNKKAGEEKPMMKKLFQVLSVALLVLGGLVASANAQAVVEATRIKVDFPFNVGRKQLPAGEYRISFLNRDQSNKLILVRGLDNKAQAIVSTLGTMDHPAYDQGAVVFNQYGERFFLTRVHIGDPTYARAIIKTRAERDAARTATGTTHKRVLAPSGE